MLKQLFKTLQQLAVGISEIVEQQKITNAMIGELIRYNSDWPHTHTHNEWIDEIIKEAIYKEEQSEN